MEALWLGRDAIECCQHGYVSIGNFDGVHRGHQVMLGQLRERARAAGVPSVILTFDPHPLVLLRSTGAPPPLTTISERTRLLREYGADHVIVQPVTTAFLQQSHEEYFERVLMGQLAVRGLVEGPNFFFGRNRAGNVTALRQLCQRAGVAFDVIAPVAVADQLVSSSVIRSLLESGDLDSAVGLLGHPYRIAGMVVEGMARGRQLGFPTANIVETENLCPAPGVYAGETVLAGQRFPVATHIGPNPTFGELALKVEAHVIGFAGDLYGHRLAIDLRQRLRGVQSFGSVTELRAQLERDCAATAVVCAKPAVE